FDTLCVIEPENPFGYFCMAFCYDYIMDEYRNLNFMEEFNKAANNAVKKAEILEKKGNLTAETFLWSGGALGIRGVRRAMVGDWFGAFRDGLKAGSKLKNSIEIDSTLYDTYFGLGNYHYWKSVKSKTFWWLPFIGDERQKGINEIKLSIKKGKFTEIPGKTSLLRIYIEEKKYNEVFELADEILKEYNFLNPLWFKGFALIYTEDWQKAIDLYNEILKKLQEKYYHGIEGEIECLYFLALCNYKLGNIKEAKKYLDFILPYKGKIETKIYFYENYIDSAEKLSKEINQSD
ncbi:hypothetical protein ACFL4Z_02220, partial [candidate division KSB1 bacterium]